MSTSARPPNDLRRVVVSAAVGNVIEWYDFYIFGSLASILAVKFFEKEHPVAAFLSTVALFSVGFLIRPLGAGRRTRTHRHDVGVRVQGKPRLGARVPDRPAAADVPDRDRRDARDAQEEDLGCLA